MIEGRKRLLDREQREHVLRAADVDPGAVESFSPLGEATFNTAYRVRLTDGTGLVLKVAPDPAMPAMTYERDIMRTEELFYRTAAPVVPVPGVVCADFSRQVIDSDFLLATELPGANWWAQRSRITGAERTRLRTELGHVVAALHQVRGDGFGYPQREPASSWRSAFLAMLDLVLADAERFAAPLPWPVERIRQAVRRHADVLDEVVTPVLVHFDLWAGNILVDSGRITGLVDGERAFWGDPLADLASVALFADIEQDPAFVSGYRAAGGRLTFDESTRRRLALYRGYLYLIMLIEGVPRGYSGPEHIEMTKLVSEHLLTALAVLRA